MDIERNKEIDENILTSLIFLLSKSYEKKLTPVYKPATGIVYEIEGLDIPAEKMLALEKKGFLETVGMTSFVSCPKCGTTILSIKLACPSCKSNSLKKYDFMIHYECGYLAPIIEYIPTTFSIENLGKDILKIDEELKNLEERFKRGEISKEIYTEERIKLKQDKEFKLKKIKELENISNKNIFVCPKCKKNLKRVGIDYGRPGIMFKCNTCTEIVQYPLIILFCNNNHEFNINEADLLDFSIYKLSRYGKTFPKITNILIQVQEILSNAVEEVKILTSIKGISGKSHIVPLLIKNKNKEEILVDFILDRSDLDVQLLQTAVKTMDLNSKIFLIVKRDLPLANLNIFNPQRVKIIEVSNEKEIPEKIIQKIKFEI